MPAYIAERTLMRTYSELPREYVDEVVLVDDASSDQTVRVAAELGIRTTIHPENKGYGANQKTYYREALRHGADIAVMVHPDYQYSPKLVMAMASMIISGHFDVALGSRILGGRALTGGMTLYKYIGVKLSEYHTGYRAFTWEVLEALPLGENSDDFVFDNEMLAQAVYFGFRIGEISCPAKYFAEASSINFARSTKYGFSVLATTKKYVLQKWGLIHVALFSRTGRKTTGPEAP
jgi:glycosyltransferase involved in cell wall biosynthesis